MFEDVYGITDLKSSEEHEPLDQDFSGFGRSSWPENVPEYLEQETFYCAAPPAPKLPGRNGFHAILIQKFQKIMG